jgi:hypothetical protein
MAQEPLSPNTFAQLPCWCNRKLKDGYAVWCRNVRAKFHKNPSVYTEVIGRDKATEIIFHIRM